MKAVLLVFIGFVALSNSVFPQCPGNGLRIQSPDCEDPKNLMVSSVSCSSLQVKWRGNKTQTYIVKATYTDPFTNNTVEAEGTHISCDDNGNCSATIAVKEGANVSWSVEAVCSMESAIFYSSKISGADAYMPFCQKRPDQPKDNIVQVYPNPAANYLIVRYNGRVTGTIQFRIFDITGKKVYDKMANTVIKTNNQYTLDLHNLLAGSYVLEVYNSKSADQTKFVVVRN